MSMARRRSSLGMFGSARKDEHTDNKLSLSEQQMRDLRQIFDWLDVNGDGEIAAGELLHALKAGSPNASLAEAEEVIRSASTSSGEDDKATGKTTIGWVEFVGVFEKGLRSGDASSAAQMFELLDLEGTGYLSPHVLRDALKLWNSDASDHTVDEMIRCIDADGDGRVSLQEFADALAKKMPGQQ